MKADAPALIAVARVLSPQGNRGEVRVESLTDNPERLVRPGRFVLSRDSGDAAVEGDRNGELISGRPHGKFYALKFRGIDSISDAETLRNLWVKVPRAELAELPDDTYYLFEIIGLDVVTETGERLGTVEEVMRGSGNDVYVVRGQREILLPAVREVVLSVDREHRIMTVQLPLPYEEGGGHR